MAGGLAAPVPLAPGAQMSPAHRYHRTLCSYFSYLFGGLIHAPSCSRRAWKQCQCQCVEWRPSRGATFAPAAAGTCLNDVAKSGTQMHRFTALAAEARTAVFRAPAVISGDPWRTLGGPLGSVKREKTLGNTFS